jgi:transposase
MKIRRKCKLNNAAIAPVAGSKSTIYTRCNGHMNGIFTLTVVVSTALCGINRFTHMPPNSKRDSLRNSGTFNPRANHVRHRLFAEGGFFDPEDLVQLKYEALRALKSDNYTISRASEEFGLSRPTIYLAQAQFDDHGLEGILPDKRGPKKPHKLTDRILAYLREALTGTPDLTPTALARKVRQRFRTQLHPRTIEKALKSRAKGGRQATP